MKKWLSRNWAYLVAAAVIIAIIAATLRWVDWLDNHAGAVQAGAVAILVVVTGLYAWQTKKQADASVKMAEEMRRQTLVQMAPYLLLRVKGGSLEGDEQARVSIQVCNARKTPAINVTVAILPSDLSRSSDPRAKSYLSGQEEWETNLLLVSKGRDTRRKAGDTLAKPPLDTDEFAEEGEPVISSEDEITAFAKRKLQSIQYENNYWLVSCCESANIKDYTFGSALSFYYESLGFTEDGTECGPYEARPQDLIFWEEFKSR